MEYTKRFQYQSNLWYRDGLKKAMIHDLSGAILSLKKSLWYNRDNITARNLLGLVYYGRGEVSEALVEWIISKNMKSHENIANYYIKKVQENAADLEVMNQAIKKFNQCLTYCRQEGEDLAIIQLKKVIDTHPHFLKAYQLLALAYLHTEQYAKARQVLRRAHKIDTTNEITLRYMHELTTKRQQKQVSATVKEGKDQSISYNLGNETIIQPISSSLKENATLMTIVHILLGMVVGVAVIWFLVMPAVNSSQAAKTNQAIIEYSDQIAMKKNEIRLLETELETYKEASEKNATAKKKSDAMKKEYEALLDAISLYHSENYSLSELTEMLLGLETTYLGVAGTESCDRMREDIYAQQCENLYPSAQASYQVANYTTAIEALEQIKAMDETYDNGQALLLLGHAYRDSGNQERAEKVYKKVIKLFPDTEVADEAQSALDGRDVEQ